MPIVLSRLSLLFFFLSTCQCQPQDWFKSNGTPTFQCNNVSEAATNASFSWFQVLYGFLVFRVPASNQYYSLHNATLSVRQNRSSDRDFFCEARSPDGRVWRSRKAQLRYGLKTPSTAPALPIKPRSLDTPRVQRLIDGDNCYLACSFPKSSTAVWIHNGQRVRCDKTIKMENKPGESVLYIIRFNSTRDVGVYQCLVSSTGASWRPLRKPFLVAPHSRTTKRHDDLPFFHYEIVTAGELAINEDNDYEPRITSIKGSRFDVSVNGSSSNVTLTSVIVTDLDRGSAGAINCSVKDLSSKHSTRVRFQPTSSSNTSPLFGRIVLQAMTRSKQEQINITLVCTDRGKRKKNATLNFSVKLQERETATRKVSEITNNLVLMSTKPLRHMTSNAIKSFVDQLQMVTSKVKEFSSVDVVLASAKTSEVINVMSKKDDVDNREMLEKVTHLVSNTLKVDTKVLSDSEETGSVASQTLNNVGKLMDAIKVDDRSREFRSEKIAVGAVRLNSNATSNNSEIAFSSSDGKPGNAKISNATEGRVAISVRASHVLGERVEFALFENAALFEAMRPLNRTRILSPVISARAVLKRSEQQAAVKVVFNGDNLDKEMGSDAVRFCAFWNETGRSWDSAGCETSPRGRDTRCHCSHLTNFALLLDMDAQPVRREHHLALSFLSYMCLTLSCAALLLTIFVYFTYMRRKQASSRSGQKSHASAITRSRVLLALSGSLLLAHFVFLVTAFHSYAGSGCKVIALLLHFLYLSVFFWSVVEGLNVFLSLVYMALRSGRIVVHLSSFFPKAAAVTWGLALFVVVVTAGATRLTCYSPLYEGVKDASDMSICFLAGLPFYLSFVLPLVCCLAANIVILALLAFVLMRRAGGLTAKQKSRSKNKVIGFLSVCVTLNITWAIGLLQFLEGKVAMNYLFVIGNGLQGVLIFVFYCVLREEMRSHMAKTVWCLSWMEPAADESGASSSVPLTSSTSGRKTSVTSLVPRRRKSTATTSFKEESKKY